MLTNNKETLERLEKKYPGVVETIQGYEKAAIAACMHCGSANTAQVSCGITGRSMSIAASTTKFKLVPAAPKLGAYFCNSCSRFY